MIHVYDGKKTCTGCGLCAFVCPKKAIAMEPDEEGFLYPRIDTDRCVDCGLCRKRCPNQPDKIEKQRHPLSSLAAKNSDQVRENSSSGGIFTALSDTMLQEGGVVFGAQLMEDGQVCHTMAETADQRDRMRDSKYVQSDITSCFDAISQALAAGKTVLFVGTPCQTAAVGAAFPNDRKASKLLLCDLVCHGVPSPRVFSAYRQQLLKEQSGAVKSLAFRSKKAGWSCRAVTIETGGGEKSSFLLDDRYFRLYFAGLITRPCCHACIYTNLHRPSDITIGDCWGEAVRDLSIYDELGLSLVLIHTQNGMDLFGKAQKSISCEEIRLRDFMQEQLQKPSRAGESRAQFWKEFQSKSFKKVLQKYTLTGFTGKVHRVSGAVQRLLKNKEGNHA